MHLDVLGGKAAVGDARPEDRVHLGHVRAPQREDVGVLGIVVTTHRLVDAEGAHEAGNGRGHAVAGIGIEVVGAEAGLHQLGGGVAFPHRPLARAEHGDIARAAFLERRLALLFHDVEGLRPGNWLEVAVLVVLAVLHAQHRRLQPILAVHDLGEEIALDAVEAAIDRRVRIALGGDDTAILDADQHATARTTVAADALVPAHAIVTLLLRRSQAGNGHARRRSGRRNCIGLDEISPGQFHLHHLRPPHLDRIRTGETPAMPRAHPATGVSPQMY